MRKSWLIGIALAIVIGGAIWIEASNRPMWTTDSPEALAEYEKGRQALMKVYWADAQASFERALELDPDFVAAKIGLLDANLGLDKARRNPLVAELRAADRARLTERERFLLDTVLARADGDEARRRALVDEYLERRPADPFALGLKAGEAWLRQDWAEAESGFRRQLEVDPNWLQARNLLGYIAMAQGRFREAEDEFRTYRFAAPDQANPHDSLGELLILLGRYDEARAELEEALRIRPDFCASYRNLLRIALLDRRPEDVDPVVARIERNCGEREAAEARCAGVLVKAFLTGDDDAPWREEAGLCKDRLDQPDVVLHILALRSGRREAALALERKLAEQIAKYDSSPGVSEKQRTGYHALATFLEAQRLVVEGRYQEAIPKLREVDADSTWWEADGRATLKLIARLLLARALEALGDPAGAEEVIARARAVNPSFAAWHDTFDPYAPRAGLAPPSAAEPAAGGAPR